MENTATGFIGLVIMVVIYLLPTLIVYYKDHKHTTAICFLNLLFGWTGLIWLICMVWALVVVNETTEKK